MGLLDNNKMLTTPQTGLEGSDFEPIFSSEDVDVWKWSRTANRTKLRLTFRDIYAWSDDYALYLVQGKITDTPIVVEVNETNFPNIRRYSNNALPQIVHVIACPCKILTSWSRNTYGHQSSLGGESCRVCVIFSNGQIYHNYPSCNNTYDYYSPTKTRNEANAPLVSEMFSKFDESVVWDLPTRKHPVKTTTGDDATLIATGQYYYNPALPDKCYEFHPPLNAANGYGNTVGFPSTNELNNASNGVATAKRARFWRTDMEDPNANSFTFMGGYVVEHQYTMIGTYRSNSSNLPCRTCVFGTQDGGRSWYCMYEFLGNATKGVDLMQTGNVGANVYALAKRTVVVPSATDKEPSAPFTYGEDVAISSIVGDGESIVVTTSANHGLSDGNTVVIKLQSGVSANGRAFDWMANNETTSTSGGNGILFKVKVLSTTSFSVSLFPYNADSPLPIRHIHAMNHCKDGVSVSTGEDYPNGGWVMYCPILDADAFDGYNVANLATRNKFVRLTSTSASMSRALGVILRQEGKDTFCYVGVDTAHITMSDVPMPEGRTETFKHNCCGVWKIPIDGVDNFKENAEMLYNGTQTCFGLQQMGNAIVFIGQHSDFAISFDNGKSWTCSMLEAGTGQNFCHFSGLTNDRCFSIDNVLVKLKR